MDEVIAADAAPKVRVSFLDIERVLIRLNQHDIALEDRPGVYTKVR